jgi:8-oxo-dGTP pyrophosphatase MutT (NUDIX family)
MPRPTASPRAVTCGVLVTDGRQLLVGHATRAPRWDIPKGVAMPGESFIDAAMRELSEETGLEPAARALTEVGRFPYLRTKDIVLFAWMPDTLPDPALLRCRSTFIAGGRLLPEFDRFAILPWEEAMARVGASLAALLSTASVVATLRTRLGKEQRP